MMRKKQYFGTDGIRGKANFGLMTAESAMRVGMAAGTLFSSPAPPVPSASPPSASSGRRRKVVIGKDTRLSGYLLEPALTAGFVSVGMDVVLVGPIPTPGVAMLVETMRADLGVMISASHNPYYDNGIKIFGPDGAKLSDAEEWRIEHLMDTPGELNYAGPDHLGRVVRLEDARGRYLEHVKKSFPKSLTLEGIKIVIDCAHGAAYAIGPQILRELGAQVIETGTHPNGFNINERCGSTFPERIVQMVQIHRADIGIALDGDADRVLFCDEQGSIIDGDQILALMARSMQQKGTLRGGAVVSTYMANQGLEQYLSAQGLRLLRTPVGDRHVIDVMQRERFNLGGEPSGHIILSDQSVGGDGLLVALSLLAMLKESGIPASTYCHVFQPVPQILKNLHTLSTHSLEEAEIEAITHDARAALGQAGRIFVRQSGTEPLLRILIEGGDVALITLLAEQLVQQFNAHLQLPTPAGTYSST